jgi:hypothetical protein
MMPLYLVACSKQKASQLRPAKELYTSHLFRRARAVAEASGSPWRILSAAHGLLDPEKVIAPYELSLVTMPAAHRGRWARRVLRELFLLLDPARGLSANGARVVFLAGASYWQGLAFRLEDNGAEVETPLSGLGIGQQLHWLKGRLAELEGLRGCP